MPVDPDRLLHYRPNGEPLGDVHPNVEDGTIYLFSLRDGSVGPQDGSQRTTSRDMLNWESQTLAHAGAAPAQNYYVLKVGRIPGNVATAG